MNSSLIERVFSGHKKRFSIPPFVTAYAPGRVEILGNHTDYNEGFVLSAAIDAGICAAVSPSKTKSCVLSALDLNEELAFALPVDKPVQNQHWANYLLGVVNKLGIKGECFNLSFAGNVPQGAGLSSSAALEVAVALAVESLYNLNLEKVWPDYQSGRKDGGTRLSRPTISQRPDSLNRLHLAKLCQQAENEFTGARCGLLDQISAIFGVENALVFTDFRSLAVETVSLPANMCFLLANTRVKHNLVESEYNERRAACEQAAEYFASCLPNPVKALRDVSQAEFQKHSGGLDPVIARRAEHIIRENERVLEARKMLLAGRTKEFGKLMYASHESSRLLFENSCPELDFIVDALCRMPETIGARLSGGGFGGSVVIAALPEDAGQISTVITCAYEKRFGHPCAMRAIKPSAGARLINVKRTS